MSFDKKNATADEIEAYNLGKQEALDEAEGVPRTVLDLHNMTPNEIIRHKKAVDKILRTQPGMSRREAKRINAEKDD